VEKIRVQKKRLSFIKRVVGTEHNYRTRTAKVGVKNVCLKHSLQPRFLNHKGKKYWSSLILAAETSQVKNNEQHNWQQSVFGSLQCFLFYQMIIYKKYFS
jgi:hypothetical protein